MSPLYYYYYCLIQVVPKSQPEASRDKIFVSEADEVKCNQKKVIVFIAWREIYARHEKYSCVCFFAIHISFRVTRNVFHRFVCLLWYNSQRPTFVSNIIIADTNIGILSVLKHYFKLGIKAFETACRIWEVERNEALSDCTVQNWF